MKASRARVVLCAGASDGSPCFAAKHPVEEGTRGGPQGWGCHSLSLQAQQSRPLRTAHMLPLRGWSWPCSRWWWYPLLARKALHRSPTEAAPETDLGLLRPLCSKRAPLQPGPPPEPSMQGGLCRTVTHAGAQNSQRHNVCVGSFHSNRQGVFPSLVCGVLVRPPFEEQTDLPVQRNHLPLI